MLPDGSINPGGMTSFNHYALGAVAAWLERAVFISEMQKSEMRRILVIQPCIGKIVCRISCMRSRIMRTGGK